LIPGSLYLHVVALDKLGTWVEGYRPTKMRASHTFPETNTNILLSDVSGGYIYSDNNYASGGEVVISPSADIASFTIHRVNNIADPSYNLTYLEFYSSSSSSTTP
jgi:hypothetical protein